MHAFARAVSAEPPWTLLTARRVRVGSWPLSENDTLVGYVLVGRFRRRAVGARFVLTENASLRLANAEPYAARAGDVLERQDTLTVGAEDFAPLLVTPVCRVRIARDERGRKVLSAAWAAPTSFLGFSPASSDQERDLLSDLAGPFACLADASAAA